MQTETLYYWNRDTSMSVQYVWGVGVRQTPGLSPAQSYAHTGCHVTTYWVSRDYILGVTWLHTGCHVLTWLHNILSVSHSYYIKFKFTMQTHNATVVVQSTYLSQSPIGVCGWLVHGIAGCFIDVIACMLIVDVECWGQHDWAVCWRGGAPPVPGSV